MKDLLLPPLFFCLSFMVYSQNSVPIDVLIEDENEEVDEPDFYTVVDEMPEFPGGEANLIKYLSSIAYPPFAKEKKIEGDVYVRFLVNEYGRIVEVEAVRSAHEVLDQAAIDHISKMPKWTPGKKRGKPVRVQYIIPIRFRLNYPTTTPTDEKSKKKKK